MNFITRITAEAQKYQDLQNIIQRLTDLNVIQKLYETMRSIITQELIHVQLILKEKYKSIQLDQAVKLNFDIFKQNMILISKIVIEDVASAVFDEPKLDLHKRQKSDLLETIPEKADVFECQIHQIQPYSTYLVKLENFEIFVKTQMMLDNLPKAMSLRGKQSLMYKQESCRRNPTDTQQEDSPQVKNLARMHLTQFILVFDSVIKGKPNGTILHLILDDNNIRAFTQSQLACLPNLEILSLSNNELSEFGPIEHNKLSSLNLARNQLTTIDESIFRLKLTQLFIQQNLFQELSKSIIYLKPTLLQLGIGWGAFCQPQLDILVQDQQLRRWFTIIKHLQVITFDNYVAAFSSAQPLEYYDSVSSLCCDSQNQEARPNIKSSCQSILIDDDLIGEHFQIENEYRQNAMHLAIIFDEIGVLAYLLKNHIHLADFTDLKGHTSLSLAIEKKLFRLVNMILKYPINVNLGGGLQFSNLHLAALSGEADMINDLLALGASASQRDVFGDTPLHLASQCLLHSKAKLMIQVFCKYNIDVNTENLKGQTPLEILVLRGNLETVAYCEAMNASQINQMNFHKVFYFQKINPVTGQSLLDVAIQNKHLNVVQFLLENNLIDITPQNYLTLYNKELKIYFTSYICARLRKQERYQLGLMINQQNPPFANMQSLEDNVELPPLLQIPLVMTQADKDDSSNDCHSDNLSCNSETKPSVLQETLLKLSSLKPKFQNSIRQSNYTLFEQQLLEEPPEDELDCLANKTNNIYCQSYVIKKKSDNDSSFRRQRSLQRSDSKQHPRQANFSPNNLSVIESRNTHVKQRKTQFALIQKQIGLISVHIQQHLQSMDKHNHKIIHIYCQTQMKIINQYLQSEDGSQLQLVDAKLFKELQRLSIRFNNVQIKNKLCQKDYDPLVFQFESI